MSVTRERFASRFGALATMVGVAIGLGNVWRFPYMVGQFGGASFVVLYAAAVVLLGLPTLMAEWVLGRHTRRGPVGAFARAGLPLGRWVGRFFFFFVAAASAYYANALGWVLYHGLAALPRLAGFTVDAGAVLPPAAGFDGVSLALQIACTATVLGVSTAALWCGVRRGIERVSRLMMPALLGAVLLLLLRTLTLPGALDGLRWYVFKFDAGLPTSGVALAALGQAFFSLSLGGTFMVVYGSYLDDAQDLRRLAAGTALGDLAAGLLAGAAIIPAVIALGLEPGTGPGLLFSTLPQVFARMPLGEWFALLFFSALACAAYLSLVAALEVLVAGIVDNTRLARPQAVGCVAAVVFVLSVPPMLNMKIFVPWDLAFGSGMQTLGALLAVVTVGWAVDRSRVLAQLCGGREVGLMTRALYVWLRYGVPSVIVLLGLHWLLTEVLGGAAAGS